MLKTTIAGSLPKPSWLAETSKLWPEWKLADDALAEAKQDATLVWIKAQEDAGIDTVGDGEQARQHFVHGFLETIEGMPPDLIELPSGCRYHPRCSLALARCADESPTLEGPIDHRIACWHPVEHAESVMER